MLFHLLPDLPAIIQWLSFTFTTLYYYEFNAHTVKCGGRGHILSQIFI